MNRIALAVAVAFVVPAFATAEIVVVESVEWKANDSPLIVIANVQKVTQDAHWCDITVAVKEVIKGNLKDKTLTYRVRLWQLRNDPASQPEAKQPINWLLFLRRGDLSGDGRELAGRWTLRDSDIGRSAIDLGNPSHVYSMKMTPCTQPDELLKTVREWARKPSPAENAQRPANLFDSLDGALMIEIPFDSPIHRMVWAGSVCYLIVPAAEEFREKVKAMAASEHAEIRAKGALLLVNYPGEDTEQILNRLISDKAQVHVSLRSGQVLKTVGEAVAIAQEVLRKRATSQPDSPPK